MKLDDYLKQEFSGSRKKGMIGVESDWLDFCSLELPHGKVHVVDTGYVTDEIEGCMVSVRPGRYEIKVKAMVYGNEVRIARLRAVTETDKPALGEKIDETGTDSATIGVCDFPTFSQLFGKNKEAAIEAFKSMMHPTRPHSIVELSNAPGGSTAAVHSGFGDGTFPVYELLHHSERAGFEVVFIKPDEPYPFEVEDKPEPTEPDEDEILHWALIEHIWDEAWAALNQGEQQTREFFGGLSPGRKAALALRIYFNWVALGGFGALITLKAQPYLSEEILAGFRLVGMTQHEQQFQQLRVFCQKVWQTADPRERIRIWDELSRFKNSSGQEYIRLQTWFRDTAKDPKFKIARFIGVYARSHPGEFPDFTF
jgi:hypothetical protein